MVKVVMANKAGKMTDLREQGFQSERFVSNTNPHGSLILLRKALMSISKQRLNVKCFSRFLRKHFVRQRLF